MLGSMLTHQDKQPIVDASVRGVVPLYYKVYEMLRRQIERGDYPEATPLPGEHELARRFGVSRVTIRRTMDILERADLITRLRGRGTFANPNAILPAAPENLSGFDRNVREFEATTQVNIIGSKVTGMPSWAPEVTDTADSARSVLELEYARFKDGVPFSHVRAYVPLGIANSIDIANFGNKTITTAIEETGTIVIDIDQKLTAISADEIEGAILRLALGHPLIRVRRVMYDSRRQLVQCLEVLYNPSYFEYHVSLSRMNLAGEAPRWVPTSN